MQNPCPKQTCLVCLSPTNGNHIQNLTTALNTTTSKATIATRPAPPIDHWISDLTYAIQDAILRDDWRVLKLLDNIFAQKYVSEPDLLKFDNSDLFTARARASKIINSSSPVLNSYSPSPAPTITQEDGVTTSSAPTVTQKDGVTSPSVPTVTHKDGVTTPSAPTVTHKDGVTNT